jgi:hypothetical protein
MQYSNLEIVWDPQVSLPSLGGGKQGRGTPRTALAQYRYGTGQAGIPYSYNL